MDTIDTIEQKILTYLNLIYQLSDEDSDEVLLSLGKL